MGQGLSRGQKVQKVQKGQVGQVVNEVKADHPQVFLEQHLPPPLARLCVKAAGWSRAAELALRSRTVQKARETARLAEARRKIPAILTKVLQQLTQKADGGGKVLSFCTGDLGELPDDVIQALEAQGFIVKRDVKIRWSVTTPRMTDPYQVWLPGFNSE